MKRILATFAALTMVTGIAFGATNSVPYTEDFESYTNNEALPVDGSTGWHASESGDLVVKTNDYSGDYVGGYYPMPDATHSKVLELVANATNNIESSTTTVWIDTVVNPTEWEGDAPTVPADAQMAFYLNTNRHVVLRHSTGGWSGSNVWTEIPEITIASGKWARVTIAMDYSFPDFVNRYFQIHINGIEVTNATAWATNDLNQGQPGSWFALADSSRSNMVAIGLNGTGYFDDLVVTNARPGNLLVPAENSYTVTASVVTGDGTIAPSGAVVVTENDDQQFAMTPGAGSAVDVLTVNGGVVTPSETYTFTNVQSNQTITVSFATNVYGVPVTWIEAAGISSNHKARLLLDEDGDGITTSNEWISSTDPLDSNSYLRVSDSASGSFEL
nr:hypothetical protein [PVC group bacterium]